MTADIAIAVLTTLVLCSVAVFFFMWRRARKGKPWGGLGRMAYIAFVIGGFYTAWTFAERMDSVERDRQEFESKATQLCVGFEHASMDDLSKLIDDENPDDSVQALADKAIQCKTARQIVAEYAPSSVPLTVGIFLLFWIAPCVGLAALLGIGFWIWHGFRRPAS